MTKSTITREQLLEIIETDHVQCGEASYLARVALAAMDSESGCLPLDYLQGHKDGLEWAAQLAEANHPETGDWLYDDPIELAKAIRKGPDMPPSQPAPVVPELRVDWQENEFSAGWSACRAAMLHGGNSPANPGCWCRTCRPVVLNDMRFVVCPDCGNKRCPRANDHRNACTGSNEPGQEGSAYSDTPREVKP